MSSSEAIRRVSPTEAAALAREQGYALVDVRTVLEFAAGHAVGAVNVPISMRGSDGLVPNPDFVEVMKRLFPFDAKLIVSCRSGSRSLRAAETLKDVGFSSVVDQRAGFEGTRDAFGGVVEPGWSRLGLPVAEGADAGSYENILAEKGAHRS